MTEQYGYAAARHGGSTSSGGRGGGGGGKKAYDQHTQDRREGRTLFVGGLSFGTTSEALRDVMQSYGAIKDCHVATAKESGRSKGFAFCTFWNAESARRAAENANGTELDGRNLTVAIADENRHKDKGFGGTQQDVDVAGYQIEKISEKDANIRLRKPRMERDNDEGYEYVMSEDEEDAMGDLADPEESFVGSLSKMDKKKLLKRLANLAEGAEDLDIFDEREKKHKKRSRHDSDDDSSSDEDERRRKKDKKRRKKEAKKEKKREKKRDRDRDRDQDRRKR